MAKKVSVTSVTPASKVKATSKAQQARTRNLVMGIATATPAGRVVKTAATAVKSATKVSSAARANARGLKAATKAKEAAKTAKTASNSVRVVKATDSMARASKNIKSNAKVQEAKLGKTAKRDAVNVDVKRGYMGVGLDKKGLTISDNVRVKVPTTPSGKQTISRGANQVMRENIRIMGKTTKTEAKANARGLKAAQKPIKEKPVKKMNRQELNDSIKKQLSNRREQDKRNYPKK